MYPIYLHNEPISIGIHYEEFLHNFVKICEQHLDHDKAKAFAFIFFDFDDDDTYQILNNIDGFSQLDRLTSNNLSVFFVNSRNQEYINNFNEVFFKTFKIQNKYTLPFVLFFQMDELTIYNVKVIELHQKLLFAFKELYDTLDNLISRLRIGPRRYKPQFWNSKLRSIRKIVLIESVKLLIEDLLRSQD